MSLQVWLPLTQDLRQQGLSNATVTNNGATFDSIGKLGGCYTFGSGKYMRATPTSSLMQAKAVSVACWVKITSWNSSYDCLISWADGTSWTNSRVTLARNNTSSNLRFTIADGTNYAGVNCTTTLALNTWYHVVGTYDGSNIKIYINGILEGTAASTLSIIYAGTFNIGGWSGNNYPINGSLNDIRLYNHCLSQMEVKELAKGLALHYPLNRDGWGQENLDNFSSVLNNWTMESLSGSNYSDSSYGNVIKLVTNAANQRMYHSVPSTLWQSGQVYTVSFLAKADQSGRTCDMSRSIADFSPTFTLTTNWKRYSGIITSTATPNGGTLSFRINQSGTTVYITQIKLEKGTIATPYCPSSSEALYTTMGLNSTTEYDCSGYCNNGTRTGTFNWTSDTPRYSVSQVFSGSQYIVEPNEINTTDSTIALWIKSTLSANAHVLDARNSDEIGKQPIYQYTNGSIQTGGSSAYVTTNTGLLVANTWVHVALVQSGNSLLIYKNGTLFQTISCNNSSIIKPTVGARLNFSNKYTGQLSDLRVYATALSAEDVLELYHTAARIDNIGNTYVYQYIET